MSMGVAAGLDEVEGGKGRASRVEEPPLFAVSHARPLDQRACLASVQVGRRLVLGARNGRFSGREKHVCSLGSCAGDLWARRRIRLPYRAYR